ncbi:hypothetical protein VPH35_122681 [Triticum aestivum]
MFAVIAPSPSPVASVASALPASHFLALTLPPLLRFLLHPRLQQFPPRPLRSSLSPSDPTSPCALASSPPPGRRSAAGDQAAAAPGPCLDLLSAPCLPLLLSNREEDAPASLR